jgi:riboflavin biosynthesis pyrimidine reductase
LEFAGLEVLFEAEDLPRWELPSQLEEQYGGPIGFDRPILFANFVSSIDGVAAIPKIKDSPAAISGGSQADRFVMGLLRASSDAIVIGAETMRQAEGHRWTPEYIYPELQDQYSKFREQRGATDSPALIIVTGSGNLPDGHPGLEGGATIVTVKGAAEKLRERLPADCRVVALGEGDEVEASDLREFLDGEGFQVVLSEAGPALFTQLLQAGYVRDLFLTCSPVLAGRDESSRPGIVSGVEFLPDRKLSAELLSLRRSGSLLFLRYRIG